MKPAQSLDYLRLLPADALARFGQGKIRSRDLVEGFKSGDHRSPYLGLSTEFAEHREYSPGDDPRTLDWRVFGRRDCYCVKRYIEETNLRATILFDCSASMGYSGTVPNPGNTTTPSKLDYAKQLAALLAYLFVRQGDAIGLVSFDSEIRKFLPAGSKPSYLRNILQILHESKPHNPSRLPRVIHEVAERIPRRGMVILISDFLDEASDLIKAMYHFGHRKHQLILFQVLAEEELTFPFRETSCFRDLEELSEALEVDPDTIRNQYLRQFNQHLKDLENGCRQMRADYTRFSTSQKIDEALFRYLAGRMGR